jgi:hypothetical protein
MKDHLPMSEARVFFSWQSDRLAREGKNLIERALDIATKRISKDLQIEEDPRDPLKLDKDTLDVPGSPPIFDTIRQKIDRAAVFVADLTFVSTRPNGDPSPNPNVTHRVRLRPEISDFQPHGRCHEYHVRRAFP